MPTSRESLSQTPDLRYPVDCGAPVCFQPKNALPGNAAWHSGSVLKIS